MLHAAALIKLRPSATNEESPLAMVCGIIPNIFYLRRFGCVVYVCRVRKSINNKIFRAINCRFAYGSVR